MAGSTVGIVPKQLFLLLLILLIILQTSHGHALDIPELFARSTDTCSNSYNQCGTSFPNNFWCPTSSTCIGTSDNTTAICCPSGQSCDYISPIDCDIQQQNATTYPKSTVKTTKLDSKLKSCGDSCCPVGYSCVSDKVCVAEKSTTTASPSTSTGSTGATFTIVPSPSASTNCDSFPPKAIIAGFFPGAIFGAVLALLITTCLRRRAHKKSQPQDQKFIPHWSQRTSSGAVMGISSPMASEDASYRTDFLLRPSARNSVGGRSTRSRLTRTGSRVRSLFNPATNPRPDKEKDVPPLPSLPNPVPAPVTPPQQRQPSTESIKIYSPPGAFAQSRKFLGPEPYPSTVARPDTTFSDLMKNVGFSSDGKGNPTFKVSEEK